jgi:hypothetical protein
METLSTSKPVKNTGSYVELSEATKFVLNIIIFV